MLKRNQPEAAGYALGENLGRFDDEAERRLLAAGQPIPERCSTCAFRKGTVPNGCVTSVMDATKCMIERVPFMCHHDKSVSTPCAGFMAIMTDGRPDGPPGVAPWPFSDEIAGRRALAEQAGGERHGEG